MNYDELSAAIQSYVENQFPTTYLADGTAVSPTAQINTFIRQAEQRIYNTVQFASLRKNVTGLTAAYNPVSNPKAMYLNCPDDFLAVYAFAVIDQNGGYEYLLNKEVNFIRQAYPHPSDTGIPKYYALFGPTVVSSNVTNELSFLLGPTPDDSYEVELHYYYYPTSIIRAPIDTFGTVTTGSGYTNGVYYDVPLTGGTGSDATANITVTGGAVSYIEPVNRGCLYSIGDTLTTAASNIGVGGSGFSVPVSAVVNPTGTSWLGNNFSSVLLYGALVEAYTYMKGEADMVALYNKKYEEAMTLAKRLGDGMERQDSYRSRQYRQPVF